MGGLDALVAKPHRDHREVDTGLQQVHGRGVPDRVGRDLELVERGGRLRGTLENNSKAMLDSRPAHVPAARVRDKRRIERGPRLLEPTTDETYRLTPERDRPIFAPFPTDVNSLAGVEAEIAYIEASKLRDPSAGVVHESQQYPISKPRAGRWVRGVEQRSNLAGLQVADYSALEPLARD